MITKLPAFPAAPFYSLDTDNSIAAQFRFDKFKQFNEAQGTPIQLSRGAAIEDGYVVSGETGIYEFTCPYFGAGDYTVEAKVTFLAFDSVASYILGQYSNGNVDSTTNSWNLRLHNNQVLFWVERRGTTTLATVTSISTERFVFELNREYHVVAERVNGVLSLYVDGNFYSSMSTAAALTNSTMPVRSQQASDSSIPDYGRCSRKIRDIRIASRALYHGAVYDNIKGFRTSLPGYVTLMYPVYRGKLKKAATKGTFTTSATSLRSTAANSWIEIAHDPKYAVGAGDFRFEITFTYHGEASNWSGKTNPLLAWGTWAAPGQPVNFEITWNPNGSGLYLSTNHSDGGASSCILTRENPVVGKRYKMAIERTNGVVHLYIDDELKGSAPWTNSIDVKVARPIMIGQRYGGNNYSVYWTTLMAIEHCWFGIPVPKT